MSSPRSIRTGRGAAREPAGILSTVSHPAASHITFMLELGKYSCRELSIEYIKDVITQSESHHQVPMGLSYLLITIMLCVDVVCSSGSVSISIAYLSSIYGWLERYDTT